VKRETKSFPFEVKATAEENNIFTFEGYASTFNNIDHGDDVVIRGAFSNSLAKNSQVPILWGHKINEPPVGISVQLYEDDKGLFIKGNLPKDDTLVSGRIIPQMKIGSIKEMSIGFHTKNFDMSKNGIRLPVEESMRSRLRALDIFRWSQVAYSLSIAEEHPKVKKSNTI
jgi:HK97 family phage prohead protease